MESRATNVMDRVIAFLNLFDGDCRECLRRSSSNCTNCRSTMAKSILAEIKAEQSSREAPVEPDYSLYARMAIITRSIRNAGRPVRSIEIGLSSVATPQLKAWTLLRMIRKGVIGRRKNGKYYVYFLKDKKGNK